MKRIIIYLLVCSLALVACQQKAESPEPEKPTTLQKPNILWIVSEDNSPWLGSYGDPVATTPRLDALAAEGILYTRAYSNAPVCAPSRAALITGAYPIAFGTEHMRSSFKTPAEIRFYPSYLREAGYDFGALPGRIVQATVEVWCTSLSKSGDRNWGCRAACTGTPN